MVRRAIKPGGTGAQRPKGSGVAAEAGGTAQDELYLTADAAAAVLGVAVASLYAYVSRKGIRSQALPGTRARLYWREDINRIAQGKAGDRSIKLDSILVPETRITLLTERGHFYRGRSAIELAETASLEDVAALLWEQDAQALFPPSTPVTPAGFAQARLALSQLPPADQASGLFPLLEQASPRSYDRSAAGFARTGAELLRWFTAIAIGADRPSAEPVHVVLAGGLEAPAEYVDIVRRLLVLFADHELSAPTYAVRAAANTGGTPYQAVTAGLVASKGRRVNEGRAPAVRRLISEVLGDPDPSRPVLERFRSEETIPGFSHSLYRSGDLRARALLTVLADRFGGEEDVRRLIVAIHVARDLAGVEPDLALLAFFVERKLKPQLGSVLPLVARSVGWIAHAYEQMESGPMVRPRTAYTGVLPRNG